ncbi:hypothetical protein H2201_009045 [Coniosporium apollinis]|uniref:JmjC domain-containing protein n=1 Tax=Coniosporium apollinis TaxID=61459 RepID=A0ABQ9NEU4_9PEZI|nr:hypothetical protein H2201_009045 [Coniosporium apollinis]
MVWSVSRDTKAFTRGSSHEPGDWASKALKQLWCPDPSTTYYAIDLRCPDAFMRIPEALSASLHVYYPEDEILPCVGNITPEFSFVDLHIDNGQDVLTTVVGDGEDCVKLWALYPPEERNLDLFYARKGQDNKFINLCDRLEGGVFAMQGSEQTMYLPAGWIHAVYTLKGGLAPGTTWSTAESFTVINDIFKREVEAKSASYDTAVPLLQSCLVALRGQNADLQQRAARELCVALKDIRKLAEADGEQWPTRLAVDVSNVLKEKYSSCPQCGQPIQAHICRGKRKRGQ